VLEGGGWGCGGRLRWGRGTGVGGVREQGGLGRCRMATVMAGRNVLCPAFSDDGTRQRGSYIEAAWCHRVCLLLTWHCRHRPIHAGCEFCTCRRSLKGCVHHTAEGAPACPDTARVACCRHTATQPQHTTMSSSPTSPPRTHCLPSMLSTSHSQRRCWCHS
jgi:hypothetical protein